MVELSNFDLACSHHHQITLQTAGWTKLFVSRNIHPRGIINAVLWLLQVGKLLMEINFEVTLQLIGRFRYSFNDVYV